jgi:hypothetical protein
MGTGRLGGVVDVATYHSGAPAFMASLEGILVPHKGCLVVSDGKAQSHTLIVFRAQDIRWDGQTLTFAGADYRIDDPIDVGGGFMQLHELRALHLPAGWTGTERAFVVAPSPRST